MEFNQQIGEKSLSYLQKYELSFTPQDNLQPKQSSLIRAAHTGQDSFLSCCSFTRLPKETELKILFNTWKGEAGCVIARKHNGSYWTLHLLSLRCASWRVCEMKMNSSTFSQALSALLRRNVHNRQMPRVPALSQESSLVFAICTSSQPSPSQIKWLPQNNSWPERIKFC